MIRQRVIKKAGGGMGGGGSGASERAKEGERRDQQVCEGVRE